MSRSIDALGTWKAASLHSPVKPCSLTNDRKGLLRHCIQISLSAQLVQRHDCCSGKGFTADLCVNVVADVDQEACGNRGTTSLPVPGNLP